MLFEFDHARSAANKQKHGIDFKEATALWEDDNGLRFQPRTKPAKSAWRGGLDWGKALVLRLHHARRDGTDNQRQAS